MQKLTREVTEIDFRMPEFRDAKPEDYEFNHENKPVRKDRWKRAIEHIRCTVGVDGRTYEISEVVEAVEALASDLHGWENLEDDAPPSNNRLEVVVEDGSILREVEYNHKEKAFFWGHFNIRDVVKWRKMKDRTVEVL